MTTNWRPVTAIVLASIVLATDPAGSPAVRAQDHTYTCVRPPCGGTPRPRPTDRAFPPLSHGASSLEPNQGLRAGESLTSPNGCFTLTMQEDGNLRLYARNQFAIWSSGTARRGRGEAVVMRTDGQLVLFLRIGGKLVDAWRAPVPSGTPGSRLLIQDDGNVVIRDNEGEIRWNTGTVRDCDGTQHLEMKAMTFNLASGNHDFPIDLSMKTQGAFIREEDPDIVFLQEVDDNCWRTRKVRQTRILASILEMYQWYFSPSFVPYECSGGGHYGDAIIASGNKISSQTIPIEFYWHPTQNTSITRVDYEFSGVTVTLINQHWPSVCLLCKEITSKRLIEEIDRLGERPIILGGDFNANLPDKENRPEDIPLKWVLEKGFRVAESDAAVIRWLGPLGSIDHILFRGLPDLSILEWELSPPKVHSDHGVGTTTFRFTQRWERIN